MLLLPLTYSTATSNLTPRQTNVSTNIALTSLPPASVSHAQVMNLTDFPRSSQRQQRHKSKRRRGRQSSRYFL